MLLSSVFLLLAAACVFAIDPKAALIIARNFALIDIDHNGRITQQEYLAFIWKSSRDTPTDADFDRFNKVDANHDRFVTADEFARAVEAAWLAPISRLDHLAIYRFIDLDVDNRVSFEELFPFYAKYRLKVPVDIRKRFDEADTSADGFLEYYEFAKNPYFANLGNTQPEQRLLK